MPSARLAYRTYGTLSAARDNVVVLPTFYTGTHTRNEGFFGAGRAVDPAYHFIVSVNLFGNGQSTSPSNAVPAAAAARFPRVTLRDNIGCQYRLLREHLGVNSIALVTGWSMAACQAFQWGAQYPDFVRAIVPFCGSARVSVHNHVFLEGAKAALTADPAFACGRYASPPVRGLKAFARVYAGWAYSQTWYRDGLYRQLGHDSAEALLQDWEADHVENWDANDLLAMLDAWQQADIAGSPPHSGDFEAALATIRARAVVIACSEDLYFPPADSAIEVQHMPAAELRVFDSPWGHCVASPGNEPRFQDFLDDAIRSVL